MKKLHKLLTAIMAVVMVLSLIASCGGTPEETTPAESTKEATPIETTPESTPTESTPEVTPETTPAETEPDPGEAFNISYDLDGGFVEGNPTE